MQRLLLPLLLLPATLFAQEREHAYLHGQIGFAGGRFSFQGDNPALDDDKAAGLFAIEFEAASRHGFGGGIRLEGYAIDNGANDDDGLFQSSPTDLGTDASNGSLFAHFTYRIEQHRFAMPIRIGLLLNGLTLEDNLTGLQVSYASVGPCFEVEPEVMLVRSGGFRLSLYGMFGVAACATSIDIDNDSSDYESDSVFVNAEAGMRARYRFAELGLAYVGRFQSMDRSSIEAGFFVNGYDADFQGLLFTFGVAF